MLGKLIHVSYASRGGPSSRGGPTPLGGWVRLDEGPPGTPPGGGGDTKFCTSWGDLDPKKEVGRGGPPKKHGKTGILKKWVRQHL